jgi:hypothetical protein
MSELASAKRVRSLMATARQPRICLPTGQLCSSRLPGPRSRFAAIGRPRSYRLSLRSAPRTIRTADEQHIPHVQLVTRAKYGDSQISLRKAQAA